MERTLAILKPDCLRRGLMGLVLSRIEAEGFTVRAMRMRRLSQSQAETLYAVHQGKHFFDSLIEFMTSGPCVTLILERENGIDEWRRVLESLRAEHCDDLTQNLAHGSDAAETAAFESAYLFGGYETV